MDDKRFDDLARRLAAVRSRRATTQLLGGGVLAALLAPWGLRDAAAKNRRHRGGRLVARWLAAIQAHRATGRPQGGGAFMASLASAGRSDTEAKRKHHKHKNKRKNKHKNKPETKQQVCLCSAAGCTSQRVTNPSSVINQNPRCNYAGGCTTNPCATTTTTARPTTTTTTNAPTTTAAATTTTTRALTAAATTTPLYGAARGVREQGRVL